MIIKGLLELLNHPEVALFTYGYLHVLTLFLKSFLTSFYHHRVKVIFLLFIILGYSVSTILHILSHVVCFICLDVLEKPEDNSTEEMRSLIQLSQYSKQILVRE